MRTMIFESACRWGGGGGDGGQRQELDTRVRGIAFIQKKYTENRSLQRDCPMGRC